MSYREVGVIEIREVLRLWLREDMGLRPIALHAQARGLVIDPARVGTPTDKPRVERAVQYVRGSFFAGEDFTGEADAQRHAERWCRDTAGMRIHGTTRVRPAEHFATVEAPVLLPAPTEPYDVPVWSTPKVPLQRWSDLAVYAALVLPHRSVGWSNRAAPSAVKGGGHLPATRPAVISRHFLRRPQPDQVGHTDNSRGHSDDQMMNGPNPSPHPAPPSFPSVGLAPYDAHQASD